MFGFRGFVYGLHGLCKFLGQCLGSLPDGFRSEVKMLGILRVGKCWFYRELSNRRCSIRWWLVSHNLPRAINSCASWCFGVATFLVGWCLAYRFLPHRAAIAFLAIADRLDADSAAALA